MQHKKFRVGDTVYCSVLRDSFVIYDFDYDEKYQRWHYTFKGASHWFAESTLTKVGRTENAAT